MDSDDDPKGLLFLREVIGFFFSVVELQVPHCNLFCLLKAERERESTFSKGNAISCGGGSFNIFAKNRRHFPSLYFFSCFSGIITSHDDETLQRKSHHFLCIGETLYMQTILLYKKPTFVCKSFFFVIPGGYPHTLQVSRKQNY
jgi:hypothetical protein